jgi:predicted nucleic acid-binding protein
MWPKLEGAFTVVTATIEDHIEGARLRNLCVGKGANISGIDCLIAARAIAGDHRLFAVDVDFDAIRSRSALKLFDRLAVS